MIEDKFALEDEAYWTDPWAGRKAVQRPLMMRGEEGFLLGAPGTMALDRHARLPLAVLRVRKSEGGSPVDFRASAVLAAWDGPEGRLRARLAFPKPPDPPAAAKAAAKGAPKGDSFSGDATAMISEASTIDMASRLGIGLAAGEYVTGIICLDKVSNHCRTRVVDSAAYHDAEAEAYLRALRDEGSGPRRVHPEIGKGEVSYRREEGSPDLPEQIGINLAVQRVTVNRADRPCLLHGSFRLPAPPMPAGAKTSPGLPTAIVPIGLLLTGSVRPEPIVLNLDVPSYVPAERVGGQATVTGYFSMDLCAFAELRAAVQTYFLYAFAGDVMAGPALAAFVNPVRTWSLLEDAGTPSVAAGALIP